MQSGFCTGRPKFDKTVKNDVEPTNKNIILNIDAPKKIVVNIFK